MISTMTGKERIGNILQRKPVDRIGLFEHFWGDTFKQWVEHEGYPEGVSPEQHFGFDMSMAWVFNTTADMDYVPEIIEETEETILQKDGNGAILRRHKLHDTTPEHVDFTVKAREQWESSSSHCSYPTAAASTSRPTARRNGADAAGRFFCWCGRQRLRVDAPGLRPRVHAHGHGWTTRTGSRTW